MVESGDAGDAVPVRRSRRAVRHAGTVGGDDANLVSVLPALTSDADTPPTEQAATPAPRTSPLARSDDDTDVGWGERETGTNDDRLTTDKPPHW